MDVRPDEGMEGGVFAPYGGKYEGSGRDRGLTPFPRTSEEQGSKIQKRGAESTSVSELLLSLNTVFAIGNTGDWRLTHISKNIREIFSVFGVDSAPLF